MRLLLVRGHAKGCELSGGCRCIIAEASGARPVSTTPESLVHELLRCVHLGYVLLCLVQLLVQVELHQVFEALVALLARNWVVIISSQSDWSSRIFTHVLDSAPLRIITQLKLARIAHLLRFAFDRRLGVEGRNRLRRRCMAHLL